MKDKIIAVPDPEKEEYGYRLALRMAKEKLAAIADIKEQCHKTEARFISSQAVAIDYLKQPYVLSLEDGSVTPESGGDGLPAREQILVLHYFTQAKGTPLTGKMITYQELLDGVNYFPVFSKRTIQPMVAFFGKEPESLLRTAGSLGGLSAQPGDAAVTIPAFPRVPLTLVLWKGDEEFPPEGSIMFDSTVSDYLTNDDIHALCESLVWRLVRLLKAGGDYHDKDRS